MQTITTAAAALLLAMTLAAVAAPASPTPATAELKLADGTDVGSVALTQTRSGARLKLMLKGLPPGEHAVHVHAVGKCEPPFTSAGPEPYQPLHPWHSRAGGGAVHSINT